MLNPSTADETHDDPTIKRCIDFSRRWGYGSLEVVNLFALRATCPQYLRSSSDPIGPKNDDHIRAAAKRADAVVAAWGVHGGFLSRDRAVTDLLHSRRLVALGFTLAGQPRHPLYVPASARPIDWHRVQRTRSARRPQLACSDGLR
jgi:hypothetical protein